MSQIRGPRCGPTPSDGDAPSAGSSLAWTGLVDALRLTQLVNRLLQGVLDGGRMPGAAAFCTTPVRGSSATGAAAVPTAAWKPSAAAATAVMGAPISIEHTEGSSLPVEPGDLLGHVPPTGWSRCPGAVRSTTGSARLADTVGEQCRPGRRRDV